MLARIRKSQEEREGGFTLIELLVVIIIIGILAAIAIPTFLNQREKAWKKALASDLRNSATVMEEYFNDTGTYDASTATPAVPLPSTTNVTYKFKVSDSVGTLNVAAAGATGYCLYAKSDKSFTDNELWLDSKLGKPTTTDCSGATY
ncbi:MAG TPA: prepilin-type N-terminal cleavage/methylation domain-containing protein [Nocardioidaceae bacterium]